MRAKEFIVEMTTAGAVATVTKPLGGMQRRNKKQKGLFGEDADDDLLQTGTNLGGSKDTNFAVVDTKVGGWKRTYADKESADKWAAAWNRKYGHKEPVKVVPVRESIALKFHSVEIKESQITNYVKRYFDCYNIEKPHQKFISNIKRFSNKKINESAESSEIQPFLNMLNSIGTTESIGVGDHLAVLMFDINVAWREIAVSGFITPKEVVDIKMHQDGTINYIKFADGDRYPRLTPATYSGKPIETAVYFNSQDAANSSLTALSLKVPPRWELDTTDIVKKSKVGEAMGEEMVEVVFNNENAMELAYSKFDFDWQGDMMFIEEKYLGQLEDLLFSHGFDEPEDFEIDPEDPMQIESEKSGQEKQYKKLPYDEFVKGAKLKEPRTPRGKGKRQPKMGI